MTGWQRRSLGVIDARSRGCRRRLDTAVRAEVSFDVQRIFSTLAAIAVALLVTALVFGLQITDPKSRDAAVQEQVSLHFLVALSAIVFATMVHAVVLTYFMGTGRWMEETGNAYQLDDDCYKQSQKTKYRLVLQMTAGFLMLLATGAIGAVADPATPVGFESFLGMSPEMLHFTLAVTTLLMHVWVYWNEYSGIRRNGLLVEEVLRRVREIRVSRGLPVD
jgi:Na+/serine symporter